MASRKIISRNFGEQAPDFLKIKKTDKNFRTNFWKAFTYAHYELSNADLKKETLKFLKMHKDPDYEKVKGVHESNFVTVGKFCYIINRGGDVIDDAEKKLGGKIKEIIAEYDNNKKKEIPVEEETKVVANVTTIQDRIKEKSKDVASEIDAWIDEFCINRKLPVKEIEDFSYLFTQRGVKSAHVKHIIPFFKRDKDEIEEALITTDGDLKEGYSIYTKPELRKLSQFFQNLFAASELIHRSATVLRVPRKKKVIDVNTLASKIKYKAEYELYGLVSQHPVHIHGSQEVWIYNTKTRKLGCFKAFDENGLSIKGVNIINFSIDSVEKTLMKPIDELAEFKKASKVKLRTFLKDLKTIDTPLKGKINEHCIILKVVK